MTQEVYYFCLKAHLHVTQCCIDQGTFDVKHSVDLDMSVSSLSSSTKDEPEKTSTAQKTKQWLNNRKNKIFRKKTLLMRFPILKWLPNYTVQDLVADFIAGVTVGVTVIPQGLAYGTVAGLPAQVTFKTH